MFLKGKEKGEDRNFKVVTDIASEEKQVTF